MDHSTLVYREGETMKVTVEANREGYLYLIYCDANNQAYCLFPNRLQTDNHIPALRKVEVPGPGARFNLRIAPPFGREVLKAIVTPRPVKALDPEAKGRAVLLGGNAVALDAGQIKEAFDEVRSKNPSADWAEHHVILITVPRGAAPAAGPKRVGVFIGVGRYKSPHIPTLKVCDDDARQLAEVMIRRCGLAKDGTFLLLSEQATLQNIEALIFRKLPQVTRPGDTVIIYWSGHGDRLKVGSGRESHFEDFLVPYDTQTGSLEDLRNSVLRSDTFGRWMQALDGRRVVVILDACHSAAQHRLGKGLEEFRPANKQYDFLFGDLARRYKAMKDLGQKELALLASSRADQTSLVRREGDLSALTYFVVERLRAGSGAVTLKDLFAYVSKRVPEYVRQAFGRDQNPVLADETTPPLYLRKE
jgi:hypothetical protein